MAKTGEQLIVVVGGQWGDEGKGNRTLNVVETEDADVVVRWEGSNNAGHQTEDKQGRKVATHILPIGVLHPRTINVIGNRTLVDPVHLIKEADSIRNLGHTVDESNLLLSTVAHVTFPHHIQEDQLREATKGRQGTTQRGVSPNARDKYFRSGLRVEDFLSDKGRDRLAVTARKGLTGINRRRERVNLDPINPEEKLEEFMAAIHMIGRYATITNTTLFINDVLRKGQVVVGEGHQGAMLDLDHGMYPYGTSANTTASSFNVAMGISPQYVPYTISVVKLTESRVGDGPLTTEIKEEHNPELLQRLQNPKGGGVEKGATSGRLRRMAHLNIPEMNWSDMLNGTRERSASKLDCLPEYGRMALVCLALRYQGKFWDTLPGTSPEVLSECEPVYVEMPTWKEDISNVRRFSDLPEAAQNYIEFLDRETGIDTTWIGVGPHRGQYIEK
jgi:adenylosuccinate synthase